MCELNSFRHFLDTVESVRLDLDVVFGNDFEHLDTFSSRTYIRQCLHIEQYMIVFTGKTAMDSYVAKD
jgi:hypothetical protein